MPEQVKSQKRWLSIGEAAELTQLSTRTLRRYLKQNLIEGKKITSNKAWHIDYLSIPTFLRKEFI